MAPLDTSFDPGRSGSYWVVREIVVQSDDKIVVGGTFDNMGGYSRHHIARLNTDGSLDTTFVHPLDRTVYSLALQGNQVLVGVGSHYNDGYNMRAPIYRLNSDGSLDDTWDVAATGASSSTLCIFNIGAR